MFTQIEAAIEMKTTFHHSVAIANLNKSEKFVTNTTALAASKYIST